MLNRRTLVALLTVAFAPCGLAQSIIRLQTGEYAYESLGHSLSTAPDMDGDGVEEVVAFRSTQTSPGVVVMSGATGAEIHQVIGAFGTGFGSIVGSAGDVDADGVGDFVVSALHENSTGTVRVYSGLDAHVIHTFQGAHANARFGESVTAIDDVDGDGVDDLLIGASRQQGVGEALLYSGASGALIRSHTGVVNVSYFGAFVARLGDLTGDGVGDYAINAPFEKSGKAVVRIYSGAFGWVAHAIDGDTGGFGQALASAGDVDLDGSDDLLIGDWLESRAFVVSGATADTLLTLAGSCDGLPFGEGDKFGRSVLGVGDVDFDGRPDVAVGTGYNHVAKVFSGLDGAELEVFRNGHGSGNSPTNLASLTDIDGDGRRELVIAFGDSDVLSLGKVIVYADGVQVEHGDPFAFGDGTGANCPCGNAGAEGSGCANSTGVGATLAAFGSTSAALDDVYFETHGMPSSVVTVLYLGTQQVAGGLGVPFGDGLRAVGGATKRLEVRRACADGTMWWGAGLRADGGWQAGDTRHFQAWYRDPQGPCGGATNMTQAVTLTFTP